MTTGGPFPEARVGGFSRRDGTIAFYAQVNSLLRPDWVVVDLGAGRGEWLEDKVEFRRELRRLRGKVRRVVGVDVDAAVLNNPAVDEHHVMDATGRIPLGDSEIDLIVSDHTFEHVDDPTRFVGEAYRVLKPGGWIAARTPNRFGYIGIAASAVPNGLHKRVLRRSQPSRQEIDVFPTRYRMNTRRDLAQSFPESEWNLIAVPHNPEPAYFGTSQTLIRVADVLLSRAPTSVSATWHVFAQKH